MKFDVVLRGGMIYDGSGTEPYIADVAVNEGKIVAIERFCHLLGNTVFDVQGKAVAPGFIDFHSHSEWVIPGKHHPEILRPLLLQGVTTIIGGNCGFSPFPVTKESAELVLSNSRFLADDDFRFEWTGTGEYFAKIQDSGCLLNIGSLVGHGTLRALRTGNKPGPLSPSILSSVIVDARSAIDEGALGISFGLAYVPGIFADETELEALFSVVAAARGLVTVHGHTYSWTSPFFPEDDTAEAHNVRDLQSFLEIAGRTGARLNLSHMLLKGRNTWQTLPKVLNSIDVARKSGVDVTFGVIPYHWGNTLINTLLPKWFLENFDDNIDDLATVRKLKEELQHTEQRIGRDFSDIYLLWGSEPALRPYEGMSVDQIASTIGCAPLDACILLIRESNGKAKILTASYSGNEGKEESPLDSLISHPASLCEIDTIVTSPHGPHNPASFGALPKLLGRYSRLRNLIPLQTAVRKITGLAADRAGLPSIGYLRPGFDADIVVFDAMKIIDTNTIKAPQNPPKGIEKVFISGKLVADDGRVTDNRLYGRVLRKSL